MIKFIAVVCLLMLSEIAGAQMPVQVVHTGTDRIGQQLVFYYKEAIRGSNSFKIALEPTLGIRVRVVTLDPDDANRGYSTTYSVTWTWNNPQQPFDYYLTSYVGICGADRVRSCADDLLVVTSNQLEDLQRLLTPTSR